MVHYGITTLYIFFHMVHKRFIYSAFKGYKYKKQTKDKFISCFINDSMVICIVRIGVVFYSK